MTGILINGIDVEGVKLGSFHIDEDDVDQQLASCLDGMLNALAVMPDPHNAIAGIIGALRQCEYNHQLERQNPN